MTTPTVLITGANRGIGLAFAKKYKSLGYKVLATARNPAKSKELVQLLGSTNVYALDVADPSPVKDLGNTLKQTQIDLLINNAGVLYEEEFEDVTAESMLEQYKTNAIGPLLVIQSLLPSLLLSPAAKVINMTSRAGSIDDNGSSGYYGYRASKAALNMITKCLSIDLKGNGIPVVALHPGYIRTGMTGNHGDMDPEEAVERMVKVIEECGMEKTGAFLHRDGYGLPW
ncbi:hypothetical protein HK102_005433 [Quaeritorhiza haematococci]|nr:hypothetical protein HK102_005433 [Quaeritorhiza haematococci]